MTTPSPDPSALKRRQRLLLASAVTAAATAWAALQPDQDAAPRPASGVSAPPRSAAVRATASTAQPVPDAGWPRPPGTDERRAWQAPTPQGLAAWSAPSPPPPPAPPTRPAAPPNAAAPPPPPAFPYALIGRIDDGQPLALLSGPLRSFGVRVADVVDGQWRIDAVQAQGLTVTWLPGSVQKTVSYLPL